MTTEEGHIVGRVAMDVVSMAEERLDGPRLLACTVQLVVEDENDDVRVVQNSWPARD